ncbi:DUF4190 domain-containing protein [Kitasatospora sp. NBC_01287]|uniref:DUF4190 domain-containing protein n=1 Tax=Kitasatospora sp. NBC_01287 TaxID=2903573 RepID=UPI0022593127|nr:DUF4190 domain-containing protein [Kitasatospora sp. NBC_01287]MCX4745235.1 DUF4190 domain-containing protein [Kitasatospora sp. NBC_01287]
MTDAARPDGGEAAVPQDAAARGAGSSDPWAPPEGAAPQDARPADPWAAGGAPAAPGPVGAPWPPPGTGPNPYAHPYAHPYARGGPYAHHPDQRPVFEVTNGLAITSLVTGLTCCLWPAALGFGIAALVQLRRRRQRGFGLAVAGVLLGSLGLLMGTVGELNGSLHLHGSTRVVPPAPALPLPLPGDTPAAPGGPAELTPNQQDFVNDIAELEVQDRVLGIPVTDSGMAVEESQSTAQAIVDTVETLKTTRWPTELQGQIATLVNSLEADESAWNAAATDTTDPVGAFQAALRINDPSTAVATARAAFSLTDEDLPVDPDSATPGDPGSTRPDDSPAPASV